MQSFFKRHEKKYLISKEQYATFQKILSQHMEPDKYGEYLVQNIYFDNEAWDVIRSSTEKPLFKEKMRLRCYNIPDQKSKVFVELKKKFKGIVYKRRVAVPFDEMLSGSVGDVIAAENSQISRELNFYMERNAVKEKIYIAYRRNAFVEKEQRYFRITFDNDIRFRLERLDFFNPKDGIVLLPKNKILMEVKALGVMPLWLVKLLNENNVFPTAFSKYGKCYTDYIMCKTEKQKEELLSA